MNNFEHSKCMIPMMQVVLICSVLFLTGCVAVKTRTAAPMAAPIDITQTACRALYEEVDAAIDDAGMRDYGAFRIQGFPYLRTTRLLSSFSHELSDASPQWSAWIDHMADLDARARALELRNLPSTAMGGRQKDTVLDELNSCRDLLIMVDLMRPGTALPVRLREAVRIPDDYVTWWQVLGLYPITAPLVSAGISAWHSRTHDTFATPLALLPVMGKLVRWLPPATTNITATGIPLPNKPKPLNTQQISDILQRSRDPLGIPLPMAAELEQLFATFAPIWEVDVVDENDHIGRVGWRGNEATVDITHSTLYHKISHTRFGDQVLLQLNYIVWFPARPGDDIYAGKLDGINWRVTLGPNGKPWLYDTIHNCGCYHQFFLSHQLRLRQDLPSLYFEAPLLPQSAPEQQSLVLRIASRTHFIQRVYHDNVLGSQSSVIPASQPLAWGDYNVLRSLPADEGYRSLFGEYGLIAGTERPERFILWPMGVRSPGAMRQWGHHATAFNGRRHFDDAFLIESLFEKMQ
ncbi:hypothetical protein [Nitrosomonas sp. Nm166]|uniref:hypothetical protein n=1 Tax=Nitrosomonas sp. Nm166 TaxID=1881054 RepID=UPI0008E9B5C8|nr:hypothetical protein [Nitrosomonas sp. Nm166]SFE69460.1 hypothetical protein SAMN05428977_10267 [Nitrosomonas sp. Nm166]